jgi:ankyrin repeat protein
VVLIEVPNTKGGTALHTATNCSSEAAVKMLLAKGASVHGTDRFVRTPLHTSRNNKIITLLLDNGADIEARDNNSETPLFYACRHNIVIALNAFIAAGAQVDTVNTQGDTPLHVAVSNCYLTVRLSKHLWRLVHDKTSETKLVKQLKT